jgi:hypothetical protein
MDKPKPKQDDKEQSKRFIEKAREIEADENEEAFERVFKKVVPAKPIPADSLKERPEKPEHSQ